MMFHANTQEHVQNETNNNTPLVVNTEAVYHFQTPNLQGLQPIPQEQLRVEGIFQGTEPRREIQGGTESKEEKGEKRKDKKRKGKDFEEEKRKLEEKSRRLEKQLIQQREQLRKFLPANTATDDSEVSSDEEEVLSLIHI